jgi:hypothetical protein
MKRPLTMIATAGMLALVVGATLAAAAAAPISSTTDLAYSAGTSGDSFTGHVKSSYKPCKSGRLIKVFLQKAGPDQLVGQAKSSSSGGWTVSPASAKTGPYYASMDARKLDRTHQCGPDTSNTVTVSSYSTTVTVSFFTYRDGLLGRISSSNPACKRGRAVQTFKRVNGRDKAYGKQVTSNSAGDWSRAGSLAVSGRFYARVLQKKLDNTHICRAATSGMITAR